jgi:hypothetical protein
MSFPQLIPVSKELQGQSKLILKGLGLSLLKPKFFTINYREVALEAPTYEQSPSTGYDKRGGLFGLPIWDTVKLIAPNYTDNDGKEIPEATLVLDIALCEVVNNRNIVKTTVAGRNGTVKEYMSDGDNQVLIRGSLVGEVANMPPMTLLQQFQKVTTCPEAVSVQSNFLEYMRCFSLVIETPTLKQREGARNIVDFTLDCCSDIPFEIDSNA